MAITNFSLPYTTTDGRKVSLLMVDSSGPKPLIRGLLERRPRQWETSSWNLDGTCPHHMYTLAGAPFKDPPKPGSTCQTCHGFGKVDDGSDDSYSTHHGDETYYYHTVTCPDCSGTGANP